MLRSTTAPNAANAEKAIAYAKRHHLIFLKLPSQAAPGKNCARTSGEKH